MADLVSIIIPAFNQLDYCRQCVHALLANTRPPYKLILVDNASTDGVGEFFDSVPNACVLHAPENLGFAGGVNLGLAQAEGHVVLLNSDTLPPEGWLECMEGALLSDGDIGLVGPMSNCVSGSQRIEGLELESMDAINAFARDLARRKRGQLRDVARLVGFCLMIGDTALAQLGVFDEGYGIGNFEDDDYCLRAVRAGYRLCIAEDAFVFHYGGRTFMGMGITDDAWQALLQDNERRFHEKWRVKPADRSDAAQEARRLNRQARGLLAKGEQAAALRLLKQSMETFPLLEANYNDLGAVLWKMGRREEAYDYFVRAVKLSSGSSEARENLRDAAQALGKTEEAARLLQEYPQDHP
ncbi:MAG: glycosyltransferase [Nitrospiraceae bacterium]|nr:glycosyltransferase [Nitrospiraceae bacterium]